jgi:predicted aspartyl protease
MGTHGWVIHEWIGFKRRGTESMGRVVVDMVVTNHRDLIRAEEGMIRPDQIRRVLLRGVADSGSANLVLPAGVAKQLGVQQVATAVVHYADKRTQRRPMVAEVRVDLLGRDGVFQAIVEPKRDQALIGAIVLAALDFLVDCHAQTLQPRNPKYRVFEME